MEPYVIDISGLEADEAVYTSPIGTPLSDVITLHAGLYYVSENEQVSYEEIVLYAATMTLRQPKNIVTTAIQGGGGTVKQFISDDDKHITIVGQLIGEYANKYPLEQVQTLQEICAAQASVAASSRMLSIAGVDRIVIKDCSFEPKIGYPNVQVFTIEALSDEPFELILNAD